MASLPHAAAGQPVKVDSGLRYHSSPRTSVHLPSVGLNACAACMDVMQDWHQLYHEAGLRTFMAVPITANGATLGVMGLSSTAVGAFKESW